MRLSPVLAAFLAATATLGFSNSASGNSSHSETVGADGHDATIALTPKSTANSFRLNRSATSIRGVGLGAIARPQMFLAQAPATVPPAPTPVPTPQLPTQPVKPGDESTPQQETPNQIQIPLPTPTTTPAPVPAPAPEASPVPVPQPSPAAPVIPPTSAPAPTTDPEARALVAEVLVTGAEGELQAEVYRVIRTRPGRTTTQSQVQQDINAIFATGFFADVRTTAQDTPLGVRVTFEVLVNPVLQAIEVQGNTIRTLRVKPPDGKDVPLPYPQIITDIFSSQYGKVLNLVQLQEGIKKLNKIYRDNGYDLAQVPDAFRVAPNGAIVPQITVSDSGTVILQVAEGVVEGIRVRYFDKDGNECVRDDKGAFFLRTTEGQPVLDKNNRPSGCRNRTREFIITREFELKTGDVFNREVLQRDLQRVFGLGILEDVKLSLNPGTDPRQVVVLVDVTERNTGSIAAGAGISSSSGLFGTLSYQQQNFGGNNQKLGGEVQIGTSRSELLFDLNFTDPWIANDPFRTSYTLNLFKRRTISLVFDGGDDEIRLPNGDRPRVHRTGGGISFSRPLSRDVFRRSEWAASLGFQYQRVAIRDADSDLNFRDELGNKLSFSDSGKDDLFTIQFGAVRDRRNDPLRPTSGSLLRVGTEQSIPIGQGNILLNRLRGGYSFYVPTRLLKLSPGCRAANARVADCPQTFAFNVQAGTVVGDLPPYEAFALGGSNSVRGYDEGDLASTRSFLQATVEYRFPIFSVISGAVFVDAATDFGSQGSVPGDPGGVRNKPGSGIGYGLGVRIQSPLGPIRIDYGFNDQGDGRLHFGIGERF